MAHRGYALFIQTNCKGDLSVTVDRLTANAKVATVLGSIKASSDTGI
jgi:hypothetical protein